MTFETVGIDFKYKLYFLHLSKKQKCAAIKLRHTIYIVVYNFLKVIYMFLKGVAADYAR